MDIERIDAVVRRIQHHDVIGRLLLGDAPADTRARPGDVDLLDWFTATERLLAAPHLLRTLEADADRLVASGRRHLLWAGMGGSVVPVQALYQAAPWTTPQPHWLDTTDPLALDAAIRAICRHRSPDTGALHAALRETEMIAVAMGATSEEPISHLEWFIGLLENAGLPVAEHIRVFAIPDSALERYATARSLPFRVVSVAGLAVPPGRMSVPGTYPFLLALALSLRPGTGALTTVLRESHQRYALEVARSFPLRHRFVRVAAALTAAAHDGAVRLVLRLPPGWEALHTYIEQVLEQSTGKAGRGVVVFTESDGEWDPTEITVTVSADGYDSHTDVTVPAPELAAHTTPQRAAALLTQMRGWQLVAAVFGYLHSIPITTEPAVEPYKRYSKTLRTQADTDSIRPVPQTVGAVLIDDRGAYHQDGLTAVIAAMLARWTAQEPAPGRYLDLTINAELTGPELARIRVAGRQLASTRLGVPVKLRRAPAEYHVSEQAQMDGPEGLFSIRFLPRRTPPPRYGAYDSQFLAAAAVASHRALTEVGRTCLLVITPGDSENLAGFAAALLEDIRELLPARRISC